MLLWASPAGLAQVPGHINVTAFGAQPDSRTNAVVAVQRALEAARRSPYPVIDFPKGRYDFWPQYAVEREYFESNTTADNPKRLAILIEAFQNITINGGGSTFVFHDRIQPITIELSSKVTIKNLSIDWDIPLTAEAMVEAATEECVDLRIDDRQFPFVIEQGQAGVRRRRLEERLVEHHGVRRQDAARGARDR